MFFITIIGHIKHLGRQGMYVGWAHAGSSPPLATSLPTYQELSSHSGKANVSKQKPA